MIFVLFPNKDHPTRGSPDGPNFVHPALRSENFPTGRGKPGPGGLLGGEESPFYGEEGRHIRKAMEFKVGSYHQPLCILFFLLSINYFSI